MSHTNERMQTPNVTDDSERIDLGGLAPEDLTGAVLFDRHDRSVGEVVDVTTDAEGRIESIVTDVGGFLGLTNHRVALSATQVGVRRGDDGVPRLMLALTEQELRDLPELPVRPIPPGVAGYRS
jgi:hypothetical protein